MYRIYGNSSCYIHGGLLFMQDIRYWEDLLLDVPLHISCLESLDYRILKFRLMM